jgi:hypothetical protein
MSLPSFVGRAAVPLALACCIGCHVSQRGEIPGDYLARYGRNVDRLHLAKDGTFEQTILFQATGQRMSAKGTWSFDAQDAYVGLSSDFILAVDLYGRPLDRPRKGPKGEVSLSAYRILGSPRLGLNEDIDYQRR